MSVQSTFVMTPERQAALAEYLNLARRLPAPLEAYRGRSLPMEALMEARRRGLFGVTQSDCHRMLEEMVSRVRPEAKVGPPTEAEILALMRRTG